MNKWLKRTLIASAAVTAAGAVLLGAGMALGGSPSFYYDADGLHVKENTEGAVRADYLIAERGEYKAVSESGAGSRVRRS